MKLIPLTQGYYAIMDDWNFDWLSRFKWQASSLMNGFESG